MSCKPSLTIVLLTQNVYRSGCFHNNTNLANTYTYETTAMVLGPMKYPKKDQWWLKHYCNITRVCSDNVLIIPYTKCILTVTDS